MTEIKSLMQERNGTMFEARIVKKEHEPFSIMYYINGRYVSEEIFEGVSIHYVEDAANNWLSGIKVLNG